MLSLGKRLNKGSEKQFRFEALRYPECSVKETLHTMAELKEAVFYQNADRGIPVEEARRISDELIGYCVHILTERNVPMEMMQTSTDELNRYLVKALRQLQARDYSGALRELLIYESYGSSIFSSYPHLYYYKGLALYGGKDYARAAQNLRTYLEREPEDEIAHFYYGNALFHLKNYREALAAYLQALERRGKFPEAFGNVALTAGKLGDLDLERKILDSGLWRSEESQEGMAENALAEDLLAGTLRIQDDLDIWEIPVFINSYNRLGTLKALTEWLQNAGYRRIYILDNDSSYGPLLDYYASLEREAGSVRVIPLGKNWGHKALWQSGVLESLGIASPYAYTDSDVVPCEECPKDFLAPLLDILRKYPLLKKAGLGLKTDDITYFDADKTREMERRFYLHEMEPEVYFGAVDTTMALYRDYRHYNIYVSARTTGNLMARHMPWYYDYDSLPEDERYYMEHANASASLVERIKAEENL